MDLDVDGGDVFPEEDNYSKTPEVGLGADSTSKFAAPVSYTHLTLPTTPYV